ncbi:3-methyl-2-oxobutanoate hydroxymethyltransferase [Lasius niger]|uniref:3-methyl-2-oxobutanoate hydroxymethyltransferase n=1 Tax=Lasius niger TaxID=67767 RepID=A0A0J7KWB6_LASNI|nr:3-methyl-2-oxobutanoate hydroxymethyltransferase [Lasius niger]
MITVYDYPSAVMANNADIPMLLVGDSLGMVVQGNETTIPVTMEEMIYHTKMVVRGCGRAFVIADMPFFSYATLEEGIKNAVRLIQEGGAQALKIEGSLEILPLVNALTVRGIPVMAHIGLRPQSQLQMGLRIQGRDIESTQRLLEEAMAFEEAGAFGLLLECIPTEVAKIITQSVDIMTIGIGAGKYCSGQVQVWHDLLGFCSGKIPRHARRFADLAPIVTKALTDYAGEVKSGFFPTAAQSVAASPELMSALKQEMLAQDENA